MSTSRETIEIILSGSRRIDDLARQLTAALDVAEMLRGTIQEIGTAGTSNRPGGGIVGNLAQGVRAVAGEALRARAISHAFNAMSRRTPPGSPLEPGEAPSTRTALRNRQRRAEAEYRSRREALRRANAAYRNEANHLSEQRRVLDRANSEIARSSIDLSREQDALTSEIRQRRQSIILESRQTGERSRNRRTASLSRRYGSAFNRISVTDDLSSDLRPIAQRLTRRQGTIQREKRQIAEQGRLLARSSRVIFPVRPNASPAERIQDLNTRRAGTARERAQLQASYRNLVTEEGGLNEEYRELIRTTKGRRKVSRRAIKLQKDLLDLQNAGINPSRLRTSVGQNDYTLRQIVGERNAATGRIVRQGSAIRSANARQPNIERANTLLDAAEERIRTLQKEVRQRKAPAGSMPGATQSALEKQRQKEIDTLSNQVGKIEEIQARFQKVARPGIRVPALERARQLIDQLAPLQQNGDERGFNRVYKGASRVLTIARDQIDATKQQIRENERATNSAVALNKYKEKSLDQEMARSEKLIGLRKKLQSLRDEGISGADVKRAERLIASLPGLRRSGYMSEYDRVARRASSAVSRARSSYNSGESLLTSQSDSSIKIDQLTRRRDALMKAGANGPEFMAASSAVDKLSGLNKPGSFKAFGRAAKEAANELSKAEEAQRGIEKSSKKALNNEERRKALSSSLLDNIRALNLAESNLAEKQAKGHKISEKILDTTQMRADAEKLYRSVVEGTVGTTDKLLSDLSDSVNMLKEAGKTQRYAVRSAKKPPQDNIDRINSALEKGASGKILTDSQRRLVAQSDVGQLVASGQIAGLLPSSIPASRTNQTGARRIGTGRDVVTGASQLSRMAPGESERIANSVRVDYELQKKAEQGIAEQKSYQVKLDQDRLSLADKLLQKMRSLEEAENSIRSKAAKGYTFSKQVLDTTQLKTNAEELYRVAIDESTVGTTQLNKNLAQTVDLVDKARRTQAFASRTAMGNTGKLPTKNDLEKTIRAGGIEEQKLLNLRADGIDVSSRLVSLQNALNNAKSNTFQLTKDNIDALKAEVDISRDFVRLETLRNRGKGLKSGRGRESLGTILGNLSRSNKDALAFRNNLSPEQSINSIVDVFNKSVNGFNEKGASKSANAIDVGSIAKSAIASGKNVASSLGNGIYSNISQAADAGNKLAEAVKTAIDKAFGIASPSKWAKAVAKNIVTTLSQGIAVGAIEIDHALSSILGITEKYKKSIKLDIPSIQLGGASDNAARVGGFVARSTTKPRLYRKLVGIAGEGILSSPAVTEAIHRNAYEKGSLIDPIYTTPGMRRTMRASGNVPTGIPGSNLEQAIVQSAMSRLRTTGSFVGPLSGPQQQIGGATSSLNPGILFSSSGRMRGKRPNGFGQASSPLFNTPTIPDPWMTPSRGANEPILGISDPFAAAIAKYKAFVKGVTDYTASLPKLPQLTGVEVKQPLALPSAEMRATKARKDLLARQSERIAQAYAKSDARSTSVLAEGYRNSNSTTPSIPPVSSSRYSGLTQLLQATISGPAARPGLMGAGIAVPPLASTRASAQARPYGAPLAPPASLPGASSSPQGLPDSAVAGRGAGLSKAAMEFARKLNTTYVNELENTIPKVEAAYKKLADARAKGTSSGEVSRADLAARASIPVAAISKSDRESVLATHARGMIRYGMNMPSDQNAYAAMEQKALNIIKAHGNQYPLIENVPGVDWSQLQNGIVTGKSNSSVSRARQVYQDFYNIDSKGNTRSAGANANNAASIKAAEDEARQLSANISQLGNGIGTINGLIKTAANLAKATSINIPAKGLTSNSVIPSVVNGTAANITARPLSNPGVNTGSATGMTGVPPVAGSTGGFGGPGGPRPPSGSVGGYRFQPDGPGGPGNFEANVNAARGNPQKLLGLSDLASMSKASAHQLELLVSALTETRNGMKVTEKEFRKLGKSINKAQDNLARRDPNADILTRALGQRGGQAVGEGLIGGAFPLLFGQGAFGALGGGIGGAAGGFMGGMLGFGLSLIGTSIGTAIDGLIQDAQDTGKMLLDLSGNFEQVKQSALLASRGQEKLIDNLIQSGRVATADELIRSQLNDKIGAGGIESLTSVANAGDRMNRALAELGVQMQIFVSGPLTAFFNQVSGAVERQNLENRVQLGLDQASPQLKASVESDLSKKARQAKKSVIPALIDNVLPSLFAPIGLGGTFTAFKAIGDATRKVDLSTTPTKDLKAAARKLDTGNAAARQASGGGKNPEQEVPRAVKVAQENLAKMQQQSDLFNKVVDARNAQKALEDQGIAAVRAQQDLNRQSAELRKDYERQIQDIRLGVEDKVKQVRQENLQKELEIIVKQGALREQQLKNTAQVIQGSLSGDELAASLADAVTTYFAAQMSAQNEIEQRRKRFEIEISNQQLELEKYKLDVTKTVARLNLDTAKKVEEINIGIARRNEDMVRSDFRTQMRIANFRILATQAEIDVSKEQKQADLDRQLALIKARGDSLNSTGEAVVTALRAEITRYGEIANELETRRNAILNTAAPAPLAQISPVSLKSVNFSQLNSIYDKASTLRGQLKDIEDQITTLVKEGSKIDLVNLLINKSITPGRQMFKELTNGLIDYDEALGSTEVAINAIVKSYKDALASLSVRGLGTKEIEQMFSDFAKNQIELRKAEPTVKFLTTTLADFSSEIVNTRQSINSLFQSTSAYQKILERINESGGIDVNPESYKKLLEAAKNVDELTAKLKILNSLNDLAGGMTDSFIEFNKQILTGKNLVESLKNYLENVANKTLDVVLEFALRPMQEQLFKNLSSWLGIEKEKNPLLAPVENIDKNIQTFIDTALAKAAPSVPQVTPRPALPPASARSAISPRQQALLDTISYAEGTYKPNGYNIMFGGKTFKDLSRHPDKVNYASGLASAAAGRYQFMPDTWSMVSKTLGLKDFGPSSQDSAALELIKRRGVDSNAPFTPQMSNQLSPEWASFPTNAGRSFYPGQRSAKFDELYKFYQKRLKELSGAAERPYIAPSSPLVPEPAPAPLPSQSLLPANNIRPYPVGFGQPVPVEVVSQKIPPIGSGAWPNYSGPGTLIRQAKLTTGPYADSMSTSSMTPDAIAQNYKGPSQAYPIPTDQQGPPNADPAAAAATSGLSAVGGAASGAAKALDGLTGATGEVSGSASGLTTQIDNSAAATAKKTEVDKQAASAADASGKSLSKAVEGFQKSVGIGIQAISGIAMGVAGVQSIQKGGTYNTLIGLAGIFGSLGSITGMFGKGGSLSGLIGGASSATSAIAPGPIAAFAEGGRPRPYEPAMIGENGPELWVPDRPGTIIPNDQLYVPGLDNGGSSAVPIGRRSSSSAGSSYMDQGNEGDTQDGMFTQTRASIANRSSSTDNQSTSDSAPPSEIKVRYESQTINNVEYVTAEQHRKGMQEAAKRGQLLAYQGIQHSVKVRSRIGM